VRASIVIPAYNAASTLAECLDACQRQTLAAAEIIVVDDGSTDSTPEIARHFGVWYLRQQNRGPAAARNTGARIAAGDVLVFTDADCVPEPGWLENLLAGFTADAIAGVGGSYGIRNDSSMLARIVHEEIILRHLRFRDQVDYLGSFNVAYRRAAFEAAGGFDESFARASGEDNDLAYRLHDNGGTLRFAVDARVAHHHPARLLPYLRTQMRHGFWRMRLYAKHPRRSGGDDYAGLGEMLGPPVVLVLAAGVVALPIVGHPAFAAALAVLAAIYLFTTAGLTRAIARRLGLTTGLAYRGMTVLRDAARGLGLIGGIWTFVVRRRGMA
jgi:glycosyltransferase involved in cell wall biosynthesis